MIEVAVMSLMPGEKIVKLVRKRFYSVLDFPSRSSRRLNRTFFSLLRTRQRKNHIEVDFLDCRRIKSKSYF